MVKGYKNLESDEGGRIVFFTEKDKFYADTPTIAILKALCVQEGVE